MQIIALNVLTIVQIIKGFLEKDVDVKMVILMKFLKLLPNAYVYILLKNYYYPTKNIIKYI